MYKSVGWAYPRLPSYLRQCWNMALWRPNYWTLFRVKEYIFDHAGELCTWTRVRRPGASGSTSGRIDSAPYVLPDTDYRVWMIGNAKTKYFHNFAFSSPRSSINTNLNADDKRLGTAPETAWRFFAMDKFTQARLYPNLNPTEHTANVYSTTVMHMVDGREKVLMSSPGKSNLITLEARTSYDGMETAVVELDFPNIPSESGFCIRIESYPFRNCCVINSTGDADIISILCVNRSKEFDDFVLGLTYASVRNLLNIL